MNLWICAWSSTRGCLLPKVLAYEFCSAPRSPSVWEPRLCLLWRSATLRSWELGDLRLQWRRSYEIEQSKNGPDVAWRFACRADVFFLCVESRRKAPLLKPGIMWGDLYKRPTEESPQAAPWFLHLSSWRTYTHTCIHTLLYTHY